MIADPHQQRGISLPAPAPSASFCKPVNVLALVPALRLSTPVRSTSTGQAKPARPSLSVCLASCIDCRRGLNRHALMTAGTWLEPPDWCGACGRAVSGDAKLLTARVDAARATDLLESCSIAHDWV